MHKYFNRSSTRWNIKEFLAECEEETFKQKIETYLISLENILNLNNDSYDKARFLLDRYRKASMILV
jgi:hypothetical protein